MLRAIMLMFSSFAGWQLRAREVVKGQCLLCMWPVLAQSLALHMVPRHHQGGSMSTGPGHFRVSWNTTSIPSKKVHMEDSALG